MITRIIATTQPAPWLVERGVKTAEQLIVYTARVSNPANQEGWGDVAVQDVVDRLHSTLAQVTIAAGQTRGETLLPMPCLSDFFAASAATAAVAGSVSPATVSSIVSAKDKLRLLEASLLLWTRQINAVLQVDNSEAAASAAAAATGGPSSSSSSAGAEGEEGGGVESSATAAARHPTPSAEIAFWTTKATALNAMFEQLQSERVRKVLQYCDMAKSELCK